MLDQVAEQLGAPGSRDRSLKQGLEQAHVLEPPPNDEGDRHLCCCEHVVERFQAMAAPLEEVLASARSLLQDCPHHDATNWLEAFVTETRERVLQGAE